MSARIYTPEEESRLGLPPLPDVPFCGHDEAPRLNAEYEASRRRHREIHPIVESLDPAEVSTRLLTAEEIKAQK